MDDAAGVAAAGLGGEGLQGRRAGRLDANFGNRSGYGAGACGRAAEHTVLGVVQTTTGGLDVGLRPLGLARLLVEQQAIEAGQTGARRQEDGQQEGGFDPVQSREHEGV